MTSVKFSKILQEELKDLCWSAINAGDEIEHEKDETELIKKVHEISAEYFWTIKELVDKEIKKAK